MNLRKKITYFYFTFFSWLVFSLKLIIDQVVGSVLGFLLSVQAVGDTSPMRKAYIICVLIAIIMIFAEKYVRLQSKIFDLWKTLTNPVNIGQQLTKIVYYRVLNHAIQISLLLLFEIIKIISVVYCLITLAIEVKQNIFLNYVLFGILLVNSILTLALYIPLLIHVIFDNNFYVDMLDYFACWYLQCIVNVNVEQHGHVLQIKFSNRV